MGEHVSRQTEAESKLVGLLAEFQTPEALVEAAERVREEGYRRIDAFTPFPVHGLDEALAIRPYGAALAGVGRGRDGSGCRRWPVSGGRIRSTTRSS